MLSSVKSFELCFEHATDLLFVASPDGQVISANASLRSDIGSSPSDTFSLDQLFAKPNWDSVRAAATSGPTAITAFDLRTLSGDTIGFLGKVFVEEESGNYCGQFRANTWAAIPDSLTDTEHQLRAILTAVPTALMVIDATGRYRHVYNGHSDLLVDDSLVGKRLHDVMSKPEADSGVDTIAEALRLQQLVKVEYTLNIHGAERWFSGRVIPFGHDDDPCALWAATDITDLVAARCAVQAERELVKSLFELGEKERKRIAGDIHDGFIQYAVGAQMWLESLKDELTDDQTSAHEALETASQSIIDAVVEARQMINSLRPIVTDTIDLQQAIGDLAREFRKQTEAEIQVNVSGDLDGLNPVMAEVALRIVQEAVRNAVRHSQAKTISIVAENDGLQLSLSVDDDGVGFDPQSVAPERFGLVGIHRHAEVFSGEARVVSRPGSGTKIDIRMPLEEPDNSGRI